MEEEYSLSKYLGAEQIISDLKQHRAETANLYRNKSLCGVVAFDEDRVHMFAPRVDQLVIDMLERCEAIDRKIARWQMRQRLFNQYMATLTRKEADALTAETASAELTERAQSELYEIETYVAYHFHEQPPEPRVGEATDAREGMASMLAFLGV